MKRKWIVLPLSLACLFTAAAAVACEQGSSDVEVKDYTFEDWKPEMSDPDEGFKIDGVLDESVYSEKTWLRAVKMEKLDSYLDYDAAAKAIEEAAKIGMTTHYGTEGMYVAIEYKAAVGEQLYVNPDRSSTQNSIAELYLAMPQGQDIEDKYVCEIDLGPDGSMVFKKNNWGGNWDNYATTNDIMAQLGVQTNGQVGQFIDEGQQRATEYTMELFIPWEYLDKIGGEGTADLIKAGDVRMNLAPITSYNYTGTNGDVDRWWWMLGSQLDDGAWGNLNGWYHFDSDGLKAYDISVEVQGEGGKVMERFGYDQAVANNSVTFLTYADETHAIKSVTVNGKDYSDEPSAVGNGSFTVPASEVTKDLEVVVEFMDYTPVETEYTLNVNLTRFGVTTLAPAGTKVTLTGLQNYEFTVGENGQADVKLLPGTYTATVEVEGETKYLGTRVLFRIGGSDEPIEVTFGNDVFTQALFGDWKGTTIDDSNAYGENGYFTSTGNALMAITNESFLDSAFTLKMNKNSKSSNFAGPGLFFETGDGARVMRFEIGIYNGKIDVQIGARDDGAVPHITPVEYTNDVWHWFGFDNDGSYTEAWNNGTNLALTVVRSGSQIYLFIAIDGDADSLKYFGQCTIPEEFASNEAHWGVIVADAPNATHYFSLDDTAEGVAAWTEFSVKLPEDLEHGSVTADKTTAKIGETITVTISPDSGYGINQVLVNGQPAQLTDGKLLLTYENGKEITVEVTFHETDTRIVTFDVPSLQRLGESVSLDGKTILFAGSVQTTEAQVEDGKMSVTLDLGATYTVTPADYTGAVAALTVVLDAEGNVTVNGVEGAQLNFVYDAFTANLIGGTEGTAIDDSNANTEKYITATEGGRIWAVMNEGSLDSVFIATFSSNTSTNSGAFRTVIYAFEDKNGVIPLVKLGDNDQIKVEWQGWPEFGVTNINPIWNTKQYGGELFEAYNGDGIDFIMVRSGRTVYVFISVTNKPETAVLYDTYTFDAKYEGVKGHFGIGVADSVPVDGKLYFDYSDDAAEVAAWVEKAYFTVDVSKADAETSNHGEIKASADKAFVANGSITITVSTDLGYVLDKLLVNGVDRAADLVGGQLTLTAADGKTIAVVASFKEAESAKIEATVTGSRFGDSNMDGLHISFAGSSSGVFVVEGGKISGVINAGEEYTVTVEEYPGFGSFKVTADSAGKLTVNGVAAESLDFVYDVFTQNLIGSNLNENEIDDSELTGNNGVVKNVKGNSFFPITNDKFGDSVFTVTFKLSQATVNNRHFIRYIFDDKCAIMPSVKLNGEGKLIVEWLADNNWDVSHMDPGWNTVILDDVYKNAFEGDTGVDLTMVRNGNNYYVFVAVHGDDSTLHFYQKFSPDAKYATQKARWAISIWDTADNVEVPYFISEKAEDVAAWVDKAAFAEGVEFEATVSAVRLGTNYAEDGAAVLFEGETTSRTLVVKDGKVSGKLNVGEKYVVSIVGSALAPLNVTVAEDGTLNVEGGTNNALVFPYDAFQTGEAGVGNMTDLVIDDTHANEEDGYIINKHHNTVFANTTETFADSVFSVTYKNSQATKNNRWGIEYIVDVNGAEYGLRATMKVGTDAGFEDKLVFQWYGEGNPQWGWGVNNMGNSWQNIIVETAAYNNDAYKEAFLNGDGLDFTAVRSGNEVYYFISIHGKADSVFFCDSFTLTGDYTQAGYWTIAIADAKQDEEIHFDLSDNAEDVAAWVEKVPVA